jgi:sugar lactone lactonase YvrE/cephalosporin-C deacetylase-like acetyl esterase
MSRLAPLAALLLAAPAPAADEVPPNKQYLEFVRKQAAELRKSDKPPATADEWAKQAEALRANLLRAWGGEACFLPKPCPLDPQQHGDPLKRDGYTVEKVTFQTRPGVRMTANLYVPDAAKKKPAPAILQVHGHSRGAKQDPSVQARCIGAAKLGFVVLCVDAFGAGERGVGTALGEYHGDMTAATLLPVGLPLSGLQVYENTRAVDYLETRPEVDKDRIGITGESGGGNQTMYAGAWDRRFKCVVPVCSVGNYQAYLGVACCMCEVVPGALRFTEEWAVLGLVAPRPLMVINGTKDSIQFSVGEAKKSLALAAPVFKVLGKPDHVRHSVFEEPHGYSKAMREAMYGFMTLHLKGEGKGDPIPDPEIKTENPEDLRCYPGDTRPKDFMTIPEFAARAGADLLVPRAEPGTADAWAKAAGGMRTALRDRALGGFPAPRQDWPKTAAKVEGRGRVVTFTPEPGITLAATIEPGKGPPVVLLDLGGAEAARKGPLYAALKADGATVVTLDLRATGGQAVGSERVGRAPDHNSAEWALWLGRPLLGQWAFDVARLLDALGQLDGAPAKDVTVIGQGPAGLVALCTAALDDRVGAVVATESLLRFDTGVPYAGQRLGVLAPRLLPEVGDVAHLAALCAPKRVVIAGSVEGDGKAASGVLQQTYYRPAENAYRLLGKRDRLALLNHAESATVLLLLGFKAKEDEPVFEPGAKLVPLSADGAGGEGPAWDPKLGVLTSGAKGIHQLAPDGTKKVWREKAGTNGLLFDRDGRLVCCEPEARVVSRIDRDGKRTVLTDAFGGKKYNTPNDLTIDGKNRVYFSDPRYGPRTDLQQVDDKGNTVEGVYRIDPDGTVHPVVGREVERANGVLVSADDKYLFVADNNNDAAGGARKLYRFDLKADGTVEPKSRKLLYDWGKGRGPDGVKQDAKGRLYVAAGLNKPNPPAEPDDKVKGGVYVLDPDTGKLLAFVGVPTDEVTNCAFGGDDLKTLYVTGGGTLYSVRTTTPGRVVWPAKK